MKNLVSFLFAIMITISFVACNQESSADTKDAAAIASNTANNTNPTIANNSTTSPSAAKTDPTAAAEVDPDLPKTTVEFDKTVVDFGDITQGDVVKDVVKFTNTGSEPLIISSAKGSCGCTVPEWPKAPVAPGETGEIKVEFSSKGKKGKQTKTVTIQANTDPNPTRLTVKSNILVPEGAEDAATK